MLKIWGRRNSNNVQKVLWLCEEIGLGYEHEDAGGEFGRTRDPDMLARNPNAVVPTIEDDGFVLWESNVILRYLSIKYGPEEIYPTAPTSRADVERWMDWQQTTVVPPMTTIFWGRVRTPDKIPSSKIKETLPDAFARSSKCLALQTIQNKPVTTPNHAVKYSSNSSMDTRGRGRFVTAAALPRDALEFKPYSLTLLTNACMTLSSLS